MNRKVLKHSRLFASVDWQAVHQIDWYLRRTLTKDVKMHVQTLRVIGCIPSQWEPRTFYPFWSDFLGENQEIPGVVYLPPGKKKIKQTKKETSLPFLSFGVDPLTWKSLTEIDEMTCSMTARCSRRHALKTFQSFTAIQKHLNKSKHKVKLTKKIRLC